MYPDKNNEKSHIENEDFWYKDYFGERILVYIDEESGGTITECGGPSGPQYTDINGES